MMKLTVLLLLLSTTDAFVTNNNKSIQQQYSTQLFNWFDKKFSAFGSASEEDLDDQWAAQQEILKQRRKPLEDRQKYFEKVEAKRAKASQDQQKMWGWQTKQYKAGEDPINEWKKRREEGTISDLDNQYGDPKKIGGIPLPMASFGVGGEFGVGGKFDNGGRFDLRLPYADQGYVDEDADVMGKLGSMFGMKKSQKENEPIVEEEPPQKKKMWPF